MVYSLSFILLSTRMNFDARNWCKFLVPDSSACAYERVTTFQTTQNTLTFPVEATKDYPVSSVYRYGQQSLFHINEKQVRPDSQLFNSWGCNSWGKRMACPPPQPTRGSGERRKLPQQVLEYLELEIQHLISLPLTFSIFPDFP